MKETNYHVQSTGMFLKAQHSEYSDHGTLSRAPFRKAPRDNIADNPSFLRFSILQIHTRSCSLEVVATIRMQKKASSTNPILQRCVWRAL